MLSYRRVKSTNPEITRTDKTGAFEEELPGQIRVSVHHEKNCWYKPIMADIITTESTWYQERDWVKERWRGVKYIPVPRNDRVKILVQTRAKRTKLRESAKGKKELGRKCGKILFISSSNPSSSFFCLPAPLPLNFSPFLLTRGAFARLLVCLNSPPGICKGIVCFAG